MTYVDDLVGGRDFTWDILRKRDMREAQAMHHPDGGFLRGFGFSSVSANAHTKAQDRP